MNVLFAASAPGTPRAAPRSLPQGLGQLFWSLRGAVTCVPVWPGLLWVALGTCHSPPGGLIGACPWGGDGDRAVPLGWPHGRHCCVLGWAPPLPRERELGVVWGTNAGQGEEPSCRLGWGGRAAACVCWGWGGPGCAAGCGAPPSLAGAAWSCSGSVTSCCFIRCQRVQLRFLPSVHPTPCSGPGVRGGVCAGCGAAPRRAAPLLPTSSRSCCALVWG